MPHRGRIGSLLEVGTGFHGELTGLENTYLNGAILGMSRREVTSRLDEIVEFAGLERFMDTPVKRYSSGMYLRLGFAIAAHLEADILLVDEVLAVGDAEFQRRCLGKMSEVEQSGRTVLFVSHNMDAMVRLCPTAIWLDAGRVRAVGPTEQVDRRVHADRPRRPCHGRRDRRRSTAAAQVRAVRLVDDDGVPQSTLSTRSPAWIQVEVVVNEPVPGLDVSCLVLTQRRGLHPRRGAERCAAGGARGRRPIPGVVPRAADPDTWRVCGQHLARVGVRRPPATRQRRHLRRRGRRSRPAAPADHDADDVADRADRRQLRQPP